jgi:hypothetical protein
MMGDEDDDEQEGTTDVKMALLRKQRVQLRQAKAVTTSG